MEIILISAIIPLIITTTIAITVIAIIAIIAVITVIVIIAGSIGGVKKVEHLIIHLLFEFRRANPSIISIKKDLILCPIRRKVGSLA